MVFKRRDKKSWTATIVELVYPKGGWARAFGYVRYRLQRLPGSPEYIARGIWAGVFITFSPLLGLHMIGAAALAYIMRGNVIAALLATFIGNPLTYVPIAVTSMSTGYFLLGKDGQKTYAGLGQKFSAAGGDLWRNFMTLFSDQKAEWDGLTLFWNDIFFPYLIGGLVPGVIAASTCYYLAVPVIRAYQNRRKGRLRDKWAALKDKAVATAKRDGSQSGD